MVENNPNQAASAGQYTQPASTAFETDTDGDGRHDHRPSMSDALTELASLARQIKEFASTLVVAKFDAVKASLRRILVLAVLAVVGFIAGSALIITAIILMLLGAARGIGSAFGGQPWIGDLILGGFLVSLLILGIYLAPKRIAASFRRKTLAKYEQRQSQQRKRFGRDLSEAAAARQTH